jgi:hypothetical protein
LFLVAGASVKRSLRIVNLAFGVAVLSAIAVSGCAVQMVPSYRVHETAQTKGPSELLPLVGYRSEKQAPSECASCEGRQRLGDYMRQVRPYVAGPFGQPCNDSGAGYAAQQATLQPPHSKFHPVPTRPVFETQANYSPPQPIGVQLVPVPGHSHSHMLPTIESPEAATERLPTMEPPPQAASEPPRMLSESVDARSLDDADVPPSPPPAY